MKKQILSVNGKEIVFFSQKNEDFICLTDIAKSTESNAKVEKWMSNRSTVDFLGTWETMHNPEFNYNNFIELRSDSGNNTFTLSVSKWVKETQAIGIFSKQGKLGGVYAHKDIAFEFASWISPQFKLYIIKEFQRLKEEEQQKQALGRDIKRLITKANYKIHTDAIKENIVLEAPRKLQRKIYASEAEMLNVALFGQTSKEWCEENPKKCEVGNIRDNASIEQLTVLSNLEVLNAEMIKNEISQEERAKILYERAQEQLSTLTQLSSMKKIKEQYEIENMKKLKSQKSLK